QRLLDALLGVLPRVDDHAVLPGVGGHQVAIGLKRSGRKPHHKHAARVPVVAERASPGDLHEGLTPAHPRIRPNTPSATTTQEGLCRRTSSAAKPRSASWNAKSRPGRL